MAQPPSVTREMEWLSGVMSGPGVTAIAPGATLKIMGDQGKALVGRTLDLQATSVTTWTGAGNIEMDPMTTYPVYPGPPVLVPAVINIATDARFEAWTDADILTPLSLGQQGYPASRTFRVG